MSDHIVLTWDYRQQPDLDMLASAVREISGDTCHIRAIEDTGGQDYAIVVSHDQLSMDEAQEAYLAHLYRSEEVPAPAEPSTAAPVLFGLRCTNPHHHRTGEVYGTSPGRHRLASLADTGCSELVISHDGGKTWAVT
jgi:hypothetical protein